MLNVDIVVYLLGFSFLFRLIELNFRVGNGKKFKNNWLAYLEKKSYLCTR